MKISKAIQKKFKSLIYRGQEQTLDVLITGNGPGGNAETALRTLNIKIFVGAANMTVREAYEAYKNNKLKKF